MPPRAWLWSAAAVLAVAAPAAAQPPSPLELVRGIRESGMPDLALEYLAEVEKKLSAEDRKVVLLERAKCLLDAAEDEPDEGTRTSMVNEAKGGFAAFLAAEPNHPRAAEANLAVARVTSVEAKAQLNRARRMDLPPEPTDGPDRAAQERARAAAVDKQKAEAGKARPLFLLASKRFAEAAAQLKAKLDDKTLDPATRAALAREAFDADLAAAVNQYHLADTVLATGAKDALERDKELEKARAQFAALAKGPPTSRTAWVARAWTGEVLGDQGKPKDMEAEFAAILSDRRPESEDGRRLVSFFQLRRNYLDAVKENNTAKLAAVANSLQAWLARNGNLRKPTPEVLAARYYRAFALQRLALIATASLKPNPATGAVDLPPAARGQLAEAERLYRALSQSDHDYTARAGQNRMVVVRRLIGEADRPPAAYGSFEDAQMAALIQMAKMSDAERAAELAAEDVDDAAPFWAGLRLRGAAARAEAEARDRKFRVVALLERARELAATDKDAAPADVTDNLLRLVYFYDATDQPHQAAVLGEHLARTVRGAGGKGALAGLLALNGYAKASARSKFEGGDDPKAEEAAKRVDRERAIGLAAFVDKTFPEDTQTDAVRHRLAALLTEDGRPDPAFEAVIKIRPGYPGVLAARQLEGYLAAVLVGPTSKAPAERKKVVFRRAVGDLSRVPPPAPNAPEADVRGYLSCRLRLAQLYLSQSRADPEGEAAEPGYDRALRAADEALAAVPRYDVLADKGKGLNLDGLEMNAQAADVRARAQFVKARTLLDAKKLGEAAAAVGPALADAKAPLFDDRMGKWAKGEGVENDPPEVAAQKAKVAKLAYGVDRTRQDVVLVGFKVCCAQGNPKEAQALLDHLKSPAGGGIRANQEGLEQAARELAAQIPELRKQGKNKEADDLGGGLALLLKEVGALPDLPPATVLFLGQTLHTVGRHAEALAEFQKIKPPSQPDWATRNPEEYPQEVRGQVVKEIREYRFAQLYVARSLRGAARLDEAKKMLEAAIGIPPEPKGYAHFSVDFRKELATLYEARGAAAGPETAGQEWGKALKEWTALVGFAQAAVKQHLGREPKNPEDLKKSDDPEEQGKYEQYKKDYPELKARWEEEGRRARSNYLDAFFDVLRVEVTANTKLIKDPAKLAPTFDRVAKRYTDLENLYKLAEAEKKGEGVIAPPVWTRYADLLDAHPPLKAAYKAAGGKFFLDRPKPAAD